jgi:hypothetical protein
MDVADLEDLAHPADAEAVDDLILAVEESRRIRALKIRDALTAVRAEIVLGVDLLLTAKARYLAHGCSGPVWNQSRICVSFRAAQTA